MQKAFRNSLIPFFLAIPFFALAQNQYAPFKGSVHLGTGIGTIIDFNLDNAGFLFPIQIGVEAMKYLSPTEYLTFGFTVANRGTRYRERIESQTYRDRMMFTHRSTTWYVLKLLYLDVPISYHISISWFNKYDSFFLTGLNNSWLLRPPIYNGALRVDDEFFRNYNMSLFAGISIQKHRNFRWSCKLNQSILSILKPEFKKEIKEIDEKYSARIFPVELIITCAFIFN